MIIRRISEGIRRQDWFTVMVEVVIVVVGVYVGIFIGDAAKERAVQAETVEILGVLKKQLKADLENLNKIIDYRKNHLADGTAVYQTLVKGDFDKKKMSEDLFYLPAETRTFFPNRSAYQSLRDQGYLPKIGNADLQFNLANLYDRVYVRHEVNADESDTVSMNVSDLTIDVYWDRHYHQYIGDEKIALARLKNGVSGMLSVSEHYIMILETTVRPELEKLIVSLIAHIENVKD